MQIEVLFFGIAKDITQRSSLNIEVESNTSVTQLQEKLASKFSNFEAIFEYAVAVNEAYADKDLVLNHGDIVAIIPPVSGG